MALEDFEHLLTGNLERSQVCRWSDDGDTCTEQAVVSYDKRLCFRHAFIVALDEDEEAQQLALGWAAAHVLSDRYVKPRRG